MANGQKLYSDAEIAEIVSRSRLWAERPPDRILLERSDLPADMKRQVALQVSLLPGMKRKMPRFARAGGYIPARINFEQSSSETTARYKQRFVSDGDAVCDLTAGLGTDSRMLAAQARRTTCCEVHPATARALQYNMSLLLPEGRVPAVRVADALTCCDDPGLVADCTLIYADPSRRDAAQADRRTADMADYAPAPQHLYRTLERRGYRGRLLLKLSPMLDIHRLLCEFPRVEELHIVQAREEVKELLLLADFGAAAGQPADPRVVVALLSERAAPYTWSYRYAEQRSPATPYAPAPLRYLYLPAPAVMKSGAFHLLAGQCGLQLLSAHSHLYTGGEPAHFPWGKGYRIVEDAPYSKKGIRSVRERYPELSVMTRHFPVTARELKQQLKTRESDTLYLLGTTLADGSRRLLILSPIGPDPLTGADPER